ncbi:monoacylglycerol/Diacylglycerol O-acyltransferase-like isoform X2 [Ahaetulla prasina]|nr:monoacylglycerol/Diacylglycerol O-acyltransferase-like isoform X2 [Ahaetulla prasina]
MDSKKWDKPKRFLTLAAKWHGKILHSYEVSGVENLPKEPSIIVYYHGAFPMDHYFFVHKIYRLTGKFICSVVDRIFFTIPGINLILALHYTYYPTREKSINLLKEGHQLIVAPGGLREQNYGNNHYKLIWRKRKGFAHIAINAKVPIVPMFTQNIREGYITYGNTRPMRWLHERMRWFTFPLYGMFPVKLITHIGKPIPYDPDVTAEKLAEKTQKAIEALQKKHQKIPGSILHALRQRFEIYNKEKQ